MGSHSTRSWQQDHLTVLENLNGCPFLSLVNLNVSQTVVGVLRRLDIGGV
jgi:hypothetical protein